MHTNFSFLLFAIPLVILIVAICRNVISKEKINNHYVSMAVFFYILVLQLSQQKENMSLLLIVVSVIGIVFLSFRIYKLKKNTRGV